MPAVTSRTSTDVPGQGFRTGWVDFFPASRSTVVSLPPEYWTSTVLLLSVATEPDTSQSLGHAGATAMVPV